jgi:hypothetical protein
MSTVRAAVSSFRYHWLGVRIGGADATLRGQWPLLAVSLVVVFACFFAIGRLVHSGPGAAQVAGQTVQVRPSAQAAIPSGLSGGSPIAGSVPAAIAPKPQPVPQPVASEAQLHAAPSTQSLTAGRTGVTPATAQPAPVTPAPVHEAAPEPQPTVASAPSQAGGESGAPSDGAPAGGASHSQPSGGGSFDSSE